MADAESLWEGRPRSFWVQALHHPEGEMRWKAVDALRHIAIPSETIPLFCSVMKNDAYWKARALAVHALYDMAWEVEYHSLLNETIIPLAEMLEGENNDVALNAAYTLELLGPRAEAAIPALEQAMQHGDDELRSAANDALARVTGRIGTHEDLKSFPSNPSGTLDP